MNNKIIGLNVKKFRKERHLTQEALAERLDISTVHMSHIEGGSVSMSLALLSLRDTTINMRERLDNPAVVDKSFPEFWQCWEQIR